MTKDEFLQEAALRVFGSHPYMYIDTIISKSKDLTEAFFNATEQQEQASASNDDYLGRSIFTILREVDRLDKENVEVRDAKIKERYGYEPRCHKFGYATRLKKVCEARDILTIGELVNYGSRLLRAECFIGKDCIAIVKQAMKNLYGIEKW